MIIRDPSRVYLGTSNRDFKNQKPGMQLNKAMEKFGASAGINGGAEERKPFWEYNDDLWDAIIATDLSGVYYLSKPAAQHMVKQGSGCIINIASITGQVPLRLQCAYAAAKAAVINLTKAMALELADYGVRCNAVAPGSVLNPQLKEVFYNDKARAEAMLSHIPMHRTGEPEEQAAMVCFLASDAASFVQGENLNCDGGMLMNG